MTENTFPRDFQHVHIWWSRPQILANNRWIRCTSTPIFEDRQQEQTETIELSCTLSLDEDFTTLTLIQLIDNDG